jgi:putative hydrolase of the HAD superfamily
MRNFDIVFFDAGETLVHPRPTFAGLFSRVCAAHGFEVDPARVTPVTDRILVSFADKQKDGWTFSSNPDASRDFWLGFYQQTLTELGMVINATTLATRLYETFSNPANFEAYEDVEPALVVLKKEGYRLGIISNFEAWLEVLLSDLGLAEHFDPVLISGIVGIEKPHPDIFARALDEAGVEAHRAVHVGDSLTSDVKGAEAIGITAILLDRHDRYGDEGYLRITDLRDIPRLLAERPS